MSSKDDSDSLFQMEEDYYDMNSIEQSINSFDFKIETKTDYEFKQQIERSMFRKPKLWKSKGSERDIEENKPVPTREKITYKWKLPPRRLLAKANFEDSINKVMKNQYVKLEPRPKEIFEISDILITDSCVQTDGSMVDREMQTVLGAKDNKCIQSVTEDEEMFQYQPLTDRNQALDDFLQKHVPNLVNQLHHNQLYDLYRDDYKELGINERKNPFKQSSTNVKLLPSTYQNPLSPKRYVSSHTWHPTIAGVFAVSYTTNNSTLYDSISLETSDEKNTKKNTKTITKEQYGISFGDDEDNLDSKNKLSNDKMPDKTYKEQLMFLLNKEFVQRMRLIQVIEDEKTNEKQNQQDFRNSFVYKSQDDQHFYKYLVQDFGEETYTDEAEDEQMEVYSTTNKSQWIEPNSDRMTSTLGYKHTDKKYDKIEDKLDHHDSDTESFYNIWGDDEKWLYGNKLRNIVRNMHREFNRKYNREAKEKKMFRLLESEAKNSKKKEKIKDMSKERMKLTKDLFEAGDVFKKTKNRSGINYKKKSKTQYKVLENDEDSIIKRENTQLVDEQDNSVIVWSISDQIFPKLRLESPGEVCCVDFNPINGNTVIGGLINGQICIWDITGKLEALDANESGMSEKEKNHHNHLLIHMQWSLNVKFKTKVKPAALTAIIESHDSMVTAIQWIHPMSRVTYLGKLVSMPEGKLSMQFLSTSMDGTIKVWDLDTPLLTKSKQKNIKNIRFEHPKSLNAHKSPLEMYNNRLLPTYTMIVKQLDNTLFSHITTMSFDSPMMQYKCISDKPLVIGKQQFEYVPKAPEVINRTIIVGNIMGRIGVLTWNGHSTYQEGGNREECKFIWGKHVHDGAIICIKRNMFYPDIHIVCGGHIVSIWSLKHKHDPIWWKRFPTPANSAIWSTFRPLEFRLCLNESSVIQFWNLVKYTNEPFYITDMILGDKLLTLSSPRSPMRFLNADEITFARGIHEVLDFKKNELISLTNHAGTIKMMTVDVSVLEESEIEKIRLVIQKEINRKIELDAWNEKYTKEFGNTRQKIPGNHNYKISTQPEHDASVHDDNEKSNMSQKQLEKKIRSETYQWYVNRKGPNTRLGKMKEKYLEREKQYMIETMAEKKNINEKELEKYLKEMNKKTYDEDYIEKLKSKAKEKYKYDRSNQNKIEFVFDNYSNKSNHLDSSKRNIYQLFGEDSEIEKEKLKEYIKNNTYMESEQDWEKMIDSAVIQGISISDLLRNPRLMRRQLQHISYIFEDEEGLFE